MGVYIKGLEMPNNCINCAARHGAECWLADCSYIPNFRKERPKWCPLVPVPPHGRLGDLDEIERYKERLVVDADKIKKGIRYVVDTKYIKEAPAIIPAEEGEA